MAENEQAELSALIVQLLSAYVSNNQVPTEELPKLIVATREALEGRSEPEAPPAQEYQRAVSVRKSIASPDHILSMIDGKPYKTLRRHLATAGLTPAEYIARYNLPKGYPMVAPSYSEARRATAFKLGLGGRRRASTKTETQEATPTSSPAAPANAAPRARKNATKTPTAQPSSGRRKAAAKTAKDDVAKPTKPKARNAGAKRKRAAEGDTGEPTA